MNWTLLSKCFTQFLTSMIFIHTEQTWEMPQWYQGTHVLQCWKSRIPLEICQEVFSSTNHKNSHRAIFYQPFLSQNTQRGTNQTHLLKTESNKALRGTVAARTKWICSFRADEQLCNLMDCKLCLDRHMDSNTIKVHPFLCLAKWTETGIMVEICGLENWLQNQNLCQSKSHIWDFLKSLLTSLTLPSFWKHTLNTPQLLSSHHECFKISILRTGFVIVFINNTHTVDLSITIITLACHLKATKLHCISTGRNNRTAKCFSKSIQVLQLQCGHKVEALLS